MENRPIPESEIIGIYEAQTRYAVKNARLYRGIPEGVREFSDDLSGHEEALLFLTWWVGNIERPSLGRLYSAETGAFLQMVADDTNEDMKELDNPEGTLEELYDLILGPFDS
jgi:hypothetical protein